MALVLLAAPSAAFGQGVGFSTPPGTVVTNPPNPPPAGSKTLKFSGSYNVASSQSPVSVTVKVYQKSGLNLIYIGQVTDLAPANLAWTTGGIDLVQKDGGGNPYSYQLQAYFKYTAGGTESTVSTIYDDYPVP